VQVNFQCSKDDCILQRIKYVVGSLTIIVFFSSLALIWLLKEL